MKMALNRLLGQLIIIAGQWRDEMGDKLDLEQKFHQGINQIQQITGKSKDEVVLTLLNHIEGGN